MCLSFTRAAAQPWLRDTLAAPLRRLLLSEDALQISDVRLMGEDQKLAESHNEWDSKTGIWKLGSKDPEKLEAALQRNRAALFQHSAQIFGALFGKDVAEEGSVEALPLALRRLLHSISTLSPTSTTLPASKGTSGAYSGAVGSFFVGRVVCAAIAQPVTHGVLSPGEEAALKFHASDLARDNLGMVAKVFRYTYLGPHQPMHHPDAASINDFVAQHAERLRNWLEAVVETQPFHITQMAPPEQELLVRLSTPPHFNGSRYMTLLRVISQLAPSTPLAKATSVEIVACAVIVELESRFLPNYLRALRTLRQA